MSIKVTALLALLLFALLGFVFLYERPQMADELRATEAEKKFAQVTQHFVARFTLVNTHGRFVAEKRGNDWVLVEPFETPGDWTEFEGMIETAQFVERGRVVVDEAEYDTADLAGFGLAPPQVELRFEPQTGEAFSLLFGDDLPVGQACYLSWSGGKKVVLTQPKYRSLFNLKLIDLRDKRMFPFDLDLVTRGAFKTPQGSYEVIRNGFNWDLLAPIEGCADEREVLRLLSRLEDERIVEFHKETIDDPKIYGFDNPEYQVVLHQKKKEEPWTLLLGEKVPDERQELWYGRVLNRPQVFIVERFITQSLSISLNELRYKQVFKFDRTGIDRLRLTYRDSVIECKKGGDDQWVVISPAGRTVVERNVANLIDRAHNLVAAGFADAVGDQSIYGFNDPVLRVSLWRSDVLVREIVVGQANNLWYGIANDLDGVMILSDQIMSWFKLKLTVQEGA